MPRHDRENLSRYNKREDTHLVWFHHPHKLILISCYIVSTNTNANTLYCSHLLVLFYYTTMRVSWTLQWFSSLFSVVVMLSLTTLPTFVVAPNPFSENVVALTPENWKKEVLNYKHAVFIVFCRVSCAHCRELFPVRCVQAFFNWLVCGCVLSYISSLLSSLSFV